MEAAPERSKYCCIQYRLSLQGFSCLNNFFILASKEAKSKNSQIYFRISTPSRKYRLILWYHILHFLAMTIMVEGILPSTVFGYLPDFAWLKLSIFNFRVASNALNFD